MKKYKEKQWLIKQYSDNQLSQMVVGKICDVSDVTISNWLKIHNIPIRNLQEAKQIQIM